MSAPKSTHKQAPQTVIRRLPSIGTPAVETMSALLGLAALPVAPPANDNHQGRNLPPVE